MALRSRMGIPLPARKPIVKECEGCIHIVEGDGDRFCEAYVDPGMKWSLGTCNLASHIQRGATGEERKVNPLKASKQSMKARRA